MNLCGLLNKLFVAVLVTTACAWVPRLPLRNKVWLIRSVQSSSAAGTHSTVLNSVTTMETSVRSADTTLTPLPGSPVLKAIDEDTNVASISIAIPGAATQQAFNEACDLFNEEVQKKGYKIAGFRPGAKLPPQYLFQIFGEEEVKKFCGTLLSEAILVRINMDFHSS